MTDYGCFDVRASLLLVEVDHDLLMLNGDYHLVFGHYMREGCFADTTFAHNHDAAFGLDILDMVTVSLKCNLECFELT
jgi:hypothetical protein